MRLLYSWLRDFVDVAASPDEVANTLGLRGFEVAAIEPVPETSTPPPWQPHANTTDAVIDFEITANRPDCLSVLGLAREVAVAFDLPIRLPSTERGSFIALMPVQTGDPEGLTVSLEAPDLCPRYAAAVANVAIGSSPVWLTSRLQAAGVRPINTIVDVTNYVLIELGHPMHAFDLARLAGAELRIRRARPGEVLKTLDGIERRLQPDMLVIADRDRAQAVAGVMGGERSEVSSATTTVAFESAYFDPASIRRTSKQLGLKTEASARFERGADIDAPVHALERVRALLDVIGGGRFVGPVVDRYPRRRSTLRLHLRRGRLAQLLGATVPDAEVTRILNRLGLTVNSHPAGWDIDVPSFRVDLQREVDLIEEVGRHYGFNQLDATFPTVIQPPPAPDPRIDRDRLVRRSLLGAGLSEAVTFGFIEAAAAEAFAPEAELVRVANPLSAKFDVMRPSLLPGLIEALAHNRHHGQRDVRLFEIGARFSTSSGESRGVGLGWTGTAVGEHWSGPGREVDFFDVKGVVGDLVEALGVSPRFSAAKMPCLVPGRTASIVDRRRGGEPVGFLGQLAPSVGEARGLARHDVVFVAELDLDLIWTIAQIEGGHVAGDLAVRALPRFPSVVRDLSIVLAETLPAEVISGTIQAAAAAGPAPLVHVGFFDHYQGAGVPAGKVSLSVHLRFQAADRTLTDEEVQRSVGLILQALVRDHAAIQR